MTAREDYQELMEKRLNYWKGEIEQFKAGAGKIEADAKAGYDKGLESLHAMQKEAWVNFGKMKSSSESNWEQFKSNMNKSSEDLKAAGEHMTAQFRK